MVDTSCPECGQADWVQRVPALRATGVSAVSGSDFYAGVGVSSTGLIPVMGTAVVERTTTTTLAHATALAPSQVPTRRPLLFGLAMLVPALGMAAVSVRATIDQIAASESSFASIVGVVLAAIMFTGFASTPALIAFALVVRRSRRNTRILRGHGAASAAWSGGCYCHRCGVCFWLESPAPGVSARHPFSPSEFRWVVWNIGGYGQYFGTA